MILATVAKGEDVALTGFAKFSKVKRPARMARNPATGAAVRVKAKTVAKITPLKGFKDVALGAAPAPKLTKPKAATAKKAATDAMVSTGATITHHHAVGADHRPWMRDEVGGLGVEILKAVKAVLDPAGILNPGKLIP